MVWLGSGRHELASHDRTIASFRGWAGPHTPEYFWNRCFLLWHTSLDGSRSAHTCATGSGRVNLLTTAPPGWQPRSSTSSQRTRTCCRSTGASRRRRLTMQLAPMTITTMKGYVTGTSSSSSVLVPPRQESRPRACTILNELLLLLLLHLLLLLLRLREHPPSPPLRPRRAWRRRPWRAAPVVSP